MVLCLELTSTKTSSKVGIEVASALADNAVEWCLQSKEQRIRGQSHKYTIRRETNSLSSHMLKTTNFIIELN